VQKSWSEFQPPPESVGNAPEKRKNFLNVKELQEFHTPYQINLFLPKLSKNDAKGISSHSPATTRPVEEVF